jgi:hypothetical protein
MSHWAHPSSILSRKPRSVTTEFKRDGEFDVRGKGACLCVSLGNVLGPPRRMDNKTQVKWNEIHLARVRLVNSHPQPLERGRGVATRFHDRGHALRRGRAVKVTACVSSQKRELALPRLKSVTVCNLTADYKYIIYRLDLLTAKQR